MAYIGAEPLPGQNREVDDISSSFNGSTTAFTLQVSSVNVSPESANNILINLGGVMQNPGTDYTIAASTITFTTAPASGLSFFGLILGAGINTATVADDTIGSSKLIDTAVTAGSYTTADITVDAQGRITAASNGTISGAEIADQAVTNAKVNDSAAIAGTKISPDFGSQAISTTSDSVTIGDSIIHSGDTNCKIRFPAIDTVSIENNGSESLRVDTSGRLLLGTATARAVGGETNPVLHIEGSGNTSNSWINLTRFQAGTGSANFQFAKSRSDTPGTYTVVQDNDNLGQISFLGADGTDMANYAATIKAQVDGTPGSNDMPGRLVFSTTSDGAGSVTERMRITSTGRVGIGDDDPDAQLHLKSSSPILMLEDTGTNAKFRINADSSVGNAAIDVDINSATSTPSLVFNIKGSELMRLQSSGHLLFNCTSLPSTSVAGIAFEKNGSSGVIFHSNGSATSSINVMEIKNGNGTIGTINSNGSTTTFNNLSDYRVKENAVAISDGIQRLKTLKPYRFNYIADPTKTVDGFFAHEITAVPEAITGVKDEVDSDNNPIYQGIDQSKLVPLLTAALQEAVVKIETLETKVAALESA